MRAIAIVLALGAAANATPSRAQVELALAGVERTPTEESIRKLGAGADALLIEIADDASVSRIRRTRAIRAMQWTPSPSVRAFLHEVVARAGKSARGADALDLGAALPALAAYGAVELPTVLTFVAHASADVRQGAAVALERLALRETIELLKARLFVERDAGVREAVARAIDAIRR